MESSTNEAAVEAFFMGGFLPPLVVAMAVAVAFYGFCWGSPDNLGHHFCEISWKRFRMRKGNGG